MVARRLLCLARRGLINARSAKMPPSPWLSARMIRIVYLMDMTTISDQKINDTTPRTASGETLTPGLAAFAASLRA
jgi:hypothetical protein